MNIYMHELKTRLRSVLIWSASIAALMLLFLSLFESFASQTAMVTQLMAAFPRNCSSPSAWRIWIGQHPGLLCPHVCLHPDLPGRAGRQLRFLAGLH